MERLGEKVGRLTGSGVRSDKGSSTRELSGCPIARVCMYSVFTGAYAVVLVARVLCVFLTGAVTQL